MLFSRWNGKRKASYHKELILRSGLFDVDWYAQNHNLSCNPARALGHFLKSKGADDPSVRFSSGAYLFENQDVREAGLNPLLHYLRFGQKEGRIIKDVYGRVSGVAEPLSETELARVREQFDEEFYRAANPDLHSESDLFEHFMRVGWHQGRDPTPGFSVQTYLTDHNLVGTNPFAHYVLLGAEQGFRVRYSRQNREVLGLETLDDDMRLVVVTMVRNESDIIELFMSHLLALFDDIIVVDHLSDDGTSEIIGALAQRFPQVRIRRLHEPSYIQSIAMTQIIREEPSAQGADWVFFLDADEFLPFQNRDAFVKALAACHGCPIISMRWRNVIPHVYWDDAVEITAATRFYIPPAFSSFKKIAFQPRRLSTDEVVVSQGNHSLIDCAKGAELRAFDTKFHLIHLPVRSIGQLKRKLKQGARSYQLLGPTRDKSQGSHWTRMMRATNDKVLHEGHLNAMALNYSEEQQSMEPASRDDLLALGFSDNVLTLATNASI